MPLYTVRGDAYYETAEHEEYSDIDAENEQQAEDIVEKMLIDDGYEGWRGDPEVIEQDDSVEDEDLPSSLDEDEEEDSEDDEDDLDTDDAYDDEEDDDNENDDDDE